MSDTNPADHDHITAAVPALEDLLDQVEAPPNLESTSHAAQHAVAAGSAPVDAATGKRPDPERSLGLLSLRLKLVLNPCVIEKVR